MKDLINKLRQYNKPVVGIGVTAWTRTGPAFLLPNYSIICLLETADLEAVREKCDVYSLEKTFGIEPETLEKQNTACIMQKPKVNSFLKSLGKDASLLVYKSSKKVEKACGEMGTKILASPSYVRDPFENKKEFRILGKKAGINLIPGETFLIDDFNGEKYERMKKEYGPELVFQLPDYTVGGGIGTFFIKTRDEWREFISFVGRRRHAGKNLNWVNVTKFIKGISASISACVTRYGVLCGVVQTQLNDIEEARAFKGRQGVWCGHDWGWKRFSFKIQKKAEKIAKMLGKFMGDKGYKGVFGVDLAINEETEEVWPVECNARYTAGFPAYSMMQMMQKEVGFDVFHLLEHLEIDYEIDLDSMQEIYHSPKKGAHLVMHNQTRKWVEVTGSIKAGVYKLANGNLVWQRSGFSIQDLKYNDEFCLVDRTPLKGRVLYPGERLTRVLFKDEIAVSSNKLNEWASDACRKIYKSYSLKVIPSRTEK